MHYFQQRYLRENFAFPARTGLLTIDLPNKGLLSGIEFRVVGRNGDTPDDPDSWLHDKLTKIEVIVNGSQVVKSYDARQLLAMMLYKKTTTHSHDAKNLANGACDESFYINLGRHYHDLEYMLDLSQVNDPELRIEYNFDLAANSGWTKAAGILAATFPQISVVCHLLRDTTLVPKGYIKTAEIHRVDNAPNLMFNLTVPRGPTYSNLYLQSWWQAMGLSGILDHYEVNLNSDNIIPIRTQINELLAALVRMYGLVEITQQFRGLSQENYPFPLEVGHVNGELIRALAWPDAELCHFDLWMLANLLPLRTVTTGAALVDNPTYRLTCRGTMPFGVAAIPLLDPWDEDTWIKTAELGDFWVRIELLAGATAGVTKLLGDEVVTKYVTPSWP